MHEMEGISQVVKAGDIDGLGVVYDSSGSLIRAAGETVLRSEAGWDATILSPWRRVLPKVVFPGFNGKVKSQLVVTSLRIVLLREIDVWRELKGDLTPLNLPNAAATESRLRSVKNRGGVQYCVINPAGLKVVRMRKRNWRESSWLDIKLVSRDGNRYAITIWKTDGKSEETLDLLASRFGQSASSA